jgi:lysophospholipase L1-like esterase
MWTTTDAASPLAKTPARLKLVTVCFGANDAISTDEYMRNLQAGIDAFRAVGVNSFLLITPPPSSRMNNTEDPRAYAAACKEVGKLLGVPVVDTFSALTAVPDWQQTVLLQDGLHLAGKGQQVFHDAVLAGVTEHFPSLLRTKQE